jgi:hypothetical protein
MHEMVRVMVVMAVDYPILCGPYMKINIPSLVATKIM